MALNEGTNESYGYIFALLHSWLITIDRHMEENHSLSLLLLPKVTQARIVNKVA